MTKRFRSHALNHLHSAQIPDYDSVECRSRPLAERLQSRHLLDHALVMLDILHTHPADSPDEALERLFSTQEGTEWIKERIDTFRGRRRP
jgi:hypothetical protein